MVSLPAQRLRKRCVRHSHGREAQRAPDPGSWRGQPSTLDALLDCERIATAAAIDAVRAALHCAGKVERGSAVLQHTSHTGLAVYSACRKSLSLCHGA